MRWRLSRRSKRSKRSKREQNGSDGSDAFPQHAPGQLRPLCFTPYALGNPHPKLRLVAYRLLSRDVLRRGDLLRGQANGNRRLCAGVAVADLLRQCRRQFDPFGRGQLIPHTSNRVPLEIFRGLPVGLKLRKWRFRRRKLFLHSTLAYLRRNSRRSLASMSRAVITLTRPPDNRRNTTKASRPSSVSPNAIYRFWRARLTLWLPAKTSSTSSGVYSCRSIWNVLSSSHSKPEITTLPSYQIVYTKRYRAERRSNEQKGSDASDAFSVTLGALADLQIFLCNLSKNDWPQFFFVVIGEAILQPTITSQRPMGT